MRFSDERGVALVEFALIAPILFLTLMAVLDFGRALNYWIDTQHLASEGARFAVVNRNPNTTGTLQEWVRAQGDTEELRLGSGSVTQRLRVCISFPNGQAVGQPVTVETSFRYSWLPLLGFAQSNISTTATMRIEAIPSQYSAGCAT